MAGDGVSLPTTLAQLGSVAKAQVKATVQAQPSTPFAEKLEQKNELKTQRVQKTAEQKNRGIDPENGRADKRQQRRRRRQEGFDPHGADDNDGEDAENSENEAALGRLIDLLA